MTEKDFATLQSRAALLGLVLRQTYQLSSRQSCRHLNDLVEVRKFLQDQEDKAQKQ